eukprot:1702371-Rhodomonas_salina.3
MPRVSSHAERPGKRTTAKNEAQPRMLGAKQKGQTGLRESAALQPFSLFRRLLLLSCLAPEKWAHVHKHVTHTT